MRFMAWAYLISFGATWIVAGLDNNVNPDIRTLGLTLLGLAWILGLGLSIATVIRKGE